MTRQTRVFYASDPRGSDRCFAKFLNAAAAYEADVLILNGNLTGTRIVPIVPAPGGGWRAEHGGREVALGTRAEVAGFERELADAGQYGYLTDVDELRALEGDPAAVEAAFVGLALERLRRWLDMTAAADVPRPFVNCGNDDPFELDAVLERSGEVRFCEGRALPLDDRRTLVSCGYANPTPWRCHREVCEEELAERLAAAFDGADGQLILNTHTPPFDSELDSGPVVDAQLRIRTEAGQDVLAPAGSTAVREAIERYRPVLSLHGRMEDSRGETTLGVTVALNPGSEAGAGMLRGAIIDLDAGGVLHHVLTLG
ncbi:metallophosphoesterase family protein [Pseudonocardia acaciae]|uniref:metallophosphoesterase family protein n=1 Tax=Pseudonocardia acaciae TaxID=551276 RepID=UPI0006864DF0|nr:hypothetical protein [Pseudonocardia acaciae]